MDPNTTWQIIIDHINKEETLEASRSIGELIEWLDKGGFMPEACPFNKAGLLVLLYSLASY